MRSWRKSVYSKICKRHQFCEKSRRNVAAANSQICKCKCQRQQPVQRMPSFRSGSHPTSKLLHVCFDKIVISVIIQLFKICTFTVSFWPPASPGSLCEREREGRFWWRCWLLLLLSRHKGSFTLILLHLFTVTVTAPPLRASYSRDVTRNSPSVCLLNHHHDDHLVSLTEDLIGCQQLVSLLTLMGERFAGCGFHPDSHCCQFFNIWSVQTKRVFWDFSFQYFFINVGFHPDSRCSPLTTFAQWRQIVFVIDVPIKWEQR